MSQQKATTQRRTSASGQSASTKRSATRRATPRVVKGDAPRVTKTPLRGPTKRGDVSAWKPRPKSIAIAGILCAILVAYLVGCTHFSSHFAPGTTVAGVDASGLDVAELSKRLDQRVKTYANKVSGQGLDFTVGSADISLALDGEAYAKEALAQSNAALWPINMVVPHDYTLPQGIKFSESQLHRIVNDVIDTYNGEAQANRNASVSYDANKGEFVSTNAIMSEMLDASAVYDAVSTDVTRLGENTIIDSSALLSTDTSEDDEKTAQAIEHGNNMLGLSFYLTLDGQRVAHINKNLIEDWLVVVETEDGPQVVASEDAIREWSYANLSGVVDGENETRKWEVDSSAVGQVLAEHLNNLDKSSLEVPTITLEERPPESEGAALRGRHIDVNLSTQYARLYDENGNVLWRSYIVTGDPSLDRSTPQGEFEIINLEENVTLEGADEDGDGEPDYESFVYYWMCYYGTAIGLHDATWRDPAEFGGNVFATDGSHGCVNLPLDAAAELYGLVRLGDPVVVHE